MNPSLSELIPEDMFVGTSLILRKGNAFLYGMRPAKHDGDDVIIELTGIGGALEDFDQSYAAGVAREAREETGCELHLLDCEQTYILRGPKDIQKVSLSGQERPAAVVFRYHRTPPHQPWHAHNAGAGCLIVYLAELYGDPQPVMELPWLIWLNASQVALNGREDVRLGALIEAGAMLVPGRNQAPDLRSWVRLTDSQEALAIALGSSMIDFYESVGKSSQG